MATVRIEGIPDPVTVDDSALSLDDAGKAALVEDIRAEWAKRQTNRPAPTRDTSFLGALQHGVEGEIAGHRNSARIIGGDRAVRPEAPEGNYQPAMPDLVEGVRNFDLPRAAGAFPRAITEALPGVGASVAAGAAGAGAGFLVGGPIGATVGGLLGAGAAGAHRMFGDTAETRARNNNRTTIEGEDLAGAAGTAAAVGALDAVGARGVGAAAGGVVRRAAMPVGREAVTEGAQSVVQQTGETAGTERGISIDPAQAVAEAAVGGGARGATAVPAAAVGGATRAAAAAGAERSLGPLSADTPAEVAQLASIERINRLIERRGASTEALRGGRETPTEDILNSARQEITDDVHTLLQQAQEAGWMGHGNEAEFHYRGLRSVFETAARHNKELAAGEEGDAGPQYGLARIEALKAPDAFKATLRDLFIDINTLSTAARKKNLTGPFAKIGGVIGAGGTIAGGALAGGPAGALLGAAANLGGNPLPVRVGRYLGGKVDKWAGLNAPAVVLARSKTQRLLQAKGIDAGDTLDNLHGLQQSLSDEEQAIRMGMGLNMDPAHISKQSLSAFKRRIGSGIDITEDDLKRLLPEDQADFLRWVQEDTLRAEVKRNERDDKRLAKTTEQHEAMLAEQARRDADLDRMAALGKPAAPTQAEIDAAEAQKARQDEARRNLDAPRAARQRDTQDRAATRQEATTLAGETREWEGALTRLERAQKAMQAAQAKAEEQAARSGATEEQALAAAREAAEAEKRKQIEAAYAQHAKQASAPDPYAKAQAQVEAQKQAQIDAAVPPADPVDNVAPVTRSQIAEWEALLASRKALQAAQEKSARAAAPKAPKAAQDAPGAPVEVPKVPRPKRVPKAKAETPPAAPAPVPEPAPESPPATAEERTAEAPPPDRSGASYMPRGWMGGVAGFLSQERGQTVTGRQVRDAFEGLVDRGLVTEDMAAKLRETDQIDRTTLRTITRAIDQYVGEGAGRSGPNGGERPVRNVHQFDSAAQSYQAAADRAVREGLASGDTALAELAGEMGVETETRLPGALRVFRAKALIDGSPDPVTKARRKALLTPLTARYSKKD